ncbi:hypothetical protein L249_7744 [Ophiocordyceps polyrhachis-furcata BCC 54312]|uniref:BZIP domain-containing protein n=1 Tax=Ophiocordyceps polyrhachis-furcata BCC 54312 TaxID=1330021 RepID=A0A367L9M6_9HYPO|nr:hypothetical protein L249_7744 [Ophiocordyceps polyrhachis-furcata BCC 54312]
MTFAEPTLVDPRLGLPLFGITSAKEAAETPVLTPHMFDKPLPPPPALVAPMITPRASRTPPAKAEADQGPRKRRRPSLSTARRARCLERNRVAASKCREKKKQWVHDLEASKAELERHHASLQREYGDLLDQATRIKTSLMAHAACNDHNIDSWIEAEATRFVERSHPQRNPAQPEAVSAPPTDGHHMQLTSAAVGYDFLLTEDLFPDTPSPLDDKSVTNPT